MAADVHTVEEEPCARTLSAYLPAKGGPPPASPCPGANPATTQRVQPIEEQTIFTGRSFHTCFVPVIPRVAAGRVCIGVANYNLGRFLLRCLNSLREQTLDDWHCVIVDDGSTDGSDLLYDTLEDSRVTLIRFPRNFGQPVAKGATIEFARQNGFEYWTYVDSDDRLPPDSLEKRVKMLDDNPSLAAVFGRLRYLIGGRSLSDESVVQSQFLCMSGSPAFRSGIPLEEALLACEHNVIPGGTVMVRVPCLASMDETMCLAPDYDLWRNLLRQGMKFGFLDAPIYEYYRHEAALSAGLSRQTKTPFELEQIRGFSAKVRGKSEGSSSARRLRVAVIDLWTGMGGAQLYFTGLVRQLRERHDFLFVVHRRDQTLVPIYEELGRVVVAGEDVAQALRENRVDLVHCWNGLQVESCLTHVRIPLLHHVQGKYGYTGRNWSKLDYRIFVSDELAELYRDVTPVPSTVLPNAIPVAEINRLVVDRPALRAALGIEPEALVLVWVGRIVPVKNVPFLLDLVDALKRYLCVRLLVVGNSWSEQLNAEFAADIEARGLRRHVVWVAGVEPRHVPCMLKAGDVFVQPSHSEGLSLAMLEAMAARTPVVVSPVGGHVDTIVDGQNGFIRPVDVDAFLAAILQLATRPTARDRIVRNAFRTVCLNHDIAQNARIVNRIYAEMTAESRGERP